MKRIAAECPTCHETVTPEEIEIGKSLTCPACQDSDSNAKQEKEKGISRLPKKEAKLYPASPR